MIEKVVYRHLNSYLFGVGCLVMASTLWGIINHYSPVPFWDMWDGYIDFYRQFSEEGWKAVWRQHNEHRIVLSKLLFLIDFKIFSGNIAFLLFCNVLIQCGSVAVIVILAKNLRLGSSLSLWGVIGFTTTFLFSWMQRENFEWGFQSQFFFVYLFALLSSLFLGLAQKETSPAYGYFALSMVFYFLSSVSMASGFLLGAALFLQVLLWKRNTVLMILLPIFMALIWSLYFYNYVETTGSRSMSHVFLNQPLDILTFVGLYFGGPLYQVIPNTTAALIVGWLFILAAAIIVIHSWAQEKFSFYSAALSTTLIFIGGASVVTAAGRLDAGPGSAMSLRYMTPVAIAWVILFFLLLNEAKGRFKNLVTLFIVVACTLLLVPQKLVGNDVSLPKFDRMQAALALAMDVPDKNYLQKLYPDHGRVQRVSRYAVKNNLSVFQTLNKDLESLSNKNPLLAPTCGGGIMDVKLVPNTVAAYRIEGNVRDLFSVSDQKISIFDGAGAWVGMGLLRSGPNNTGVWQGYVKQARGEVNAFLIRDEDIICRLEKSTTLPDVQVALFPWERGKSSWSPVTKIGPLEPCRVALP